MLSYVTMSACGATEHLAEPVARGEPTLCPAPAASRLNWGPVASLRPAQGGAEGTVAGGGPSVGLQGVSAVPRPSQGYPREPQPRVPWLWPGHQLGLVIRRGASGLLTPSWHHILLHTLYFLPFLFVCFLPL